MKYEFHVGDYVEDNYGKVGYINSVKYIKSNKGVFYDIEIVYYNADIVGVFHGDQSLIQYHFNRIGQYDFTKKNKVEPLLINKNVSLYCGNGKTNSPSDYKKVFEQNELNDKVIDKINELVDAVNELRKERT